MHLASAKLAMPGLAPRARVPRSSAPLATARAWPHYAAPGRRRFALTSEASGLSPLATPAQDWSASALAWAAVSAAAADSIPTAADIEDSTRVHIPARSVDR